MSKATATEAVNLSSIPGQVKPKTIKKLVFTVSLLDFQQYKGQCEASTVCFREVGRWQLDSKIEMLFRYFRSTPIIKMELQLQSLHYK